MSRYSHDPTTHTLSLISGTNPDDYNFVGTTAEWEALTPAQKAQYESRDIIDDFNGDSIDSSPTYNSPHAVSSGGTYNAIKTVSDAIPTVDNVPTQGSTNPISSGAMFSALDDIDGELTANNKKFYFDYQDGKYGYNTSAARGADTFVPFSNGIKAMFSSTYTNINTNAPTYTMTFLCVEDPTKSSINIHNQYNVAQSFNNDYLTASRAANTHTLVVTFKKECDRWDMGFGKSTYPPASALIHYNPGDTITLNNVYVINPVFLF